MTFLLVWLLKVKCYTCVIAMRSYKALVTCGFKYFLSAFIYKIFISIFIEMENCIMYDGFPVILMKYLFVIVKAY